MKDSTLRTFVPASADVDDQSYYPQIVEMAGNTTDLITFIDLDKDGGLDFILQKQEATTGMHYLSVAFNNVASDNFFVETMLINEAQKKSDNFYGNNAVGVSYRFVRTGLDDQKSV